MNEEARTGILLVGAAILCAVVVMAADTRTPPHLTKTTHPAEDVTIMSGWVLYGQRFPISLETNSAIWYEREGAGVRWVQSPGQLSGPRPHHAMMGVRYDPDGDEELYFEDHPNGILAVVPSRDRRH